MRWFLLPSEAQQILNGQMHPSPVVLPFYPRCTFKRSTVHSKVAAKDGNSAASRSLGDNCSSSAQGCSDGVSDGNTKIGLLKDSQETEKTGGLSGLSESSFSVMKGQPKGGNKCEQDRSVLNSSEISTQGALVEQETQPSVKNDKPKFCSPPKKIMKQTIQVQLTDVTGCFINYMSMC